jgi:hypothetical protein
MTTPAHDDDGAGTTVAVVDPIMHPATGEVILPAKGTPTDVLADLRDALVVYEARVKDAKRAIDRELTGRLDFEGRRSAEITGAAGAFKLTGKAPTKVEWDADAAYRALRRLVRAGLISKDRAGECVTRVVTYTARHGALEQLRKHADERVREAIDACRDEVAVDNRTVGVTRLRDGAS